MVINTLIRQDTYTAAANGTAYFHAGLAMKYFAVQAKGTGAAATAWDMRLEGSIDGTNYTQLLAHATVDGDGVTKWLSTASPCLYFRSRCASITLGGATNVVVTILGTP